METKTVDEANSCIIQWKIKNINQCLSSKKGLKSPDFIADTLEDTRWLLYFFPMEEEDENFIGIYLHRTLDVGPDVIEVNFQLAILSDDGSVLKQKTSPKSSFKINGSLGYPKFEEREKVFITEREKFLPDDILTIQCKIWKNGGTHLQPKRLYAQTILKTNKGSFSWRIGNFSTLKCGVKKKVRDSLIDFDLVLNKEIHIEKNLEMHINSFNDVMKYFSLEIFVVDSEGRKESCGVHEVTDDLKKGVLFIPLFTGKLLANKSRYVPNDVLTLHCEFVTLTKIVLHGFWGPTATYPKLRSQSEHINELNIGTEKSQNALVLASDLKTLYSERILCDIELRTLTRTFPAHKNILSARSPVFGRMFSNDMKEKNSGQVDITDLEDDIVQRMLLYIYTDSLEDLELESASKLYGAADKYEILHLRSLCSCFLKENLCPTNACDVLALADLHQDDDLKSFVQDYILNHDEVFESQEWKDFINTNSKLAAGVMYMKVFPA